MLKPEVRLHLPAGTEFVRVDGSDYNYWHLLMTAWRWPDGFLVVEQDILPTDEQLQEILECPEPRCVFGYQRHGTYTEALGMAKFSGEFCQRTRHLFIPPEVPLAVHWSQCDGWIYQRLLDYPRHSHGEVQHLTEGSNAGYFESRNIYSMELAR